MAKHMILVSGKSGTGKSSCLRNLKNPEGVGYFNCDAGKKLPFNAKFQEVKVTNPKKIVALIKEAEKSKKIHTLVIDTASFLFTMYVNQYVMTADNAQREWGTFSTWVQNLMTDVAASSTKNLIFLCHTMHVEDQDSIVEVIASVPGKRLKQEGFEAFFSTVVSTKKVPVDSLQEFQNPLLKISDKDKRRGFKHVFQTDSTDQDCNERMRGDIDMWSIEETFIDNDLQLVIDRLEAINQPAKATGT